MKPIFETGNLEQAVENEILLLWELGPTYSLVSGMNTATNTLQFVRVWSYQEAALMENLPAIVHLLRTGGYAGNQIIVASAFPEMMLVPKEQEVKEDVLLSGLYPSKMHLFRDEVRAEHLSTVYGIPASVFQLLHDSFPQLRMVHAATAALCTHEQEAAGSIHAFFIDNLLRVVVRSGERVQLVQVYAYTTPLDAVYYLLKISTAFFLRPPEVLLVLSGFITHDSALFREIQQYFGRIRFAAPENGYGSPDGYPPHFFVSLHNLAACVS